MTKYKYIFSAIALLTLGSCKKFLTVLPVDDVSDQVTIVDASSSETAVPGASTGRSPECLCRRHLWHGYGLLLWWPF